MIPKVLVVLLAAVAGTGIYFASAKGTPAATESCCHPGSPCCEPGAACCGDTAARDAGCCGSGADCYPGSPCCEGVKGKAVKASCCEPGATCCEAGGACCGAEK